MGRISLAKTQDKSPTGQIEAKESKILCWRREHLYDKEARIELKEKGKDAGEKNQKKDQRRETEREFKVRNL